MEHKLKADIDSFQETLSSRFMEFDTHIKAALYSVSKKNPEEAAETLAKTRRIMKACTKKKKKKNEIMLKELKKEVESLTKKKTFPWKKN